MSTGMPRQDGTVRGLRQGGAVVSTCMLRRGGVFTVGKWSSGVIRGHQRSSVRRRVYRGQEGGHSKLDEPARAEAQPGLEPRLGDAKVRAEAAVELRCGGAMRRGRRTRGARQSAEPGSRDVGERWVERARAPGGR